MGLVLDEANWRSALDHYLPPSRSDGDWRREEVERIFGLKCGLKFQALRAGLHRPAPPRPVLLSKPSGGFRRLLVPPLVERVVQRAGPVSIPVSIFWLELARFDSS